MLNYKKNTLCNFNRSKTKQHIERKNTAGKRLTLNKTEEKKKKSKIVICWFIREQQRMHVGFFVLLLCDEE